MFFDCLTLYFLYYTLTIIKQYYNYIFINQCINHNHIMTLCYPIKHKRVKTFIKFGYCLYCLNLSFLYEI